MSCRPPAARANSSSFAMMRRAVSSGVLRQRGLRSYARVKRSRQTARGVARAKVVSTDSGIRPVGRLDAHQAGGRE